MLTALVLSAMVLGVAMTCVAYLTWLERKVAARFQNRIGPYHVGYPHGWLQPLADVAKLLIKEDITPRSVDRVLFNLAPVIMVAPALIGFAFIPFATGWAVVDQELELGVRSIAAPLRNASGAAVAALNVGTHVGRTDADELFESFLPRLLQTAGDVSDALAKM